MTEQPQQHSATRLRALAHPTRIAILGVLRAAGPQTAATLAEHIDEAPGTLSYHLRKLADAGLVAEAAHLRRDARERWWAAAAPATSWDEAEHSRDPEKHAASVGFSRTLMQHYAHQYGAYIESTPTLNEAWVAAGTTADRRLHLTVEQLGELRADLAALAEKWEGLSSADTPGARPVFMLTQAYALPS